MLTKVYISVFVPIVWVGAADAGHLNVEGHVTTRFEVVLDNATLIRCPGKELRKVNVVFADRVIKKLSASDQLIIFVPGIAKLLLTVRAADKVPVKAPLPTTCSV